jgi:hypothetical protein
MSTDNLPPASSRNVASPLRPLVIALAGAQTLVFALYAGFFAVQSLSGDALGIAGAVALLACLPLFLCALPALILGLKGRWMPFALVLALLGSGLAAALFVMA